MDARSSLSDTSSGRAVADRATADRLNPADLAALGNLEFVAHSVVEGFLIGLHRSPHRGFSVEFAENRPYVPGDDVRHMDWRMYARSDRYYVKQYEEETNLRAYLAVDTSRSMDWTSAPGRLVSKLEYARLLTASLAYLLLRQGDAVGLLAFDDRIRVRVQPRGTRHHLGTLLASLARLRGSGTTDAGGAIREVALRMRRRGLVVLISDLLVGPDELGDLLFERPERGHATVHELPRLLELLDLRPLDLEQGRPHRVHLGVGALLIYLILRVLEQLLGQLRQFCRMVEEFSFDKSNHKTGSWYGDIGPFFFSWLVMGLVRDCVVYSYLRRGTF